MGSPFPFGYCSVDQVCSAFPQFVRDANESISDAQINNWIANRKARIRSAFLTRGYDPDAVVVTDDLANFLNALNLDGTIADLGDALQSTITLQPGEYSIAAARHTSYERILKEITQGLHDKLFQPLVAKTIDVRPLVQGIGGAETDPTQTPYVLGQNRRFGKNMRF